MSAFTGYLIAYCCAKTKATCYEECAMATYGKWMQNVTTICMICCNIGFNVSYMVLFKSLMPYSIQLALGDDKPLPKWCNEEVNGQMFWLIIFSVLLTPISLPRKLTALRFTSAFSVMISVYIMLVIVFECLLDRGTSPTLPKPQKNVAMRMDLQKNQRNGKKGTKVVYNLGFWVSEGFKEGREKAHIDVPGIFNSLPLVIFAYMYQINIPAIYTELEQPSLSSIKKVLVIGTLLAAVGYILAGIFGYVAFAAGETEVQLADVFAAGNILQAPYRMPDSGKTPFVIYISLFGICLVVLFATPFTVLPTKDSIEEIMGKKLSSTMNVVWTVVILVVSMLISLRLTNISVVMAFLGATTNSAIGFLLPIVYFWHIEKKKPWFDTMKLISYFFFGFVCISSCIELYTLFTSPT